MSQNKSSAQHSHSETQASKELPSSNKPMTKQKKKEHTKKHTLALNNIHDLHSHVISWNSNRDTSNFKW